MDVEMRTLLQVRIREADDADDLSFGLVLKLLHHVPTDHQAVIERIAIWPETLGHRFVDQCHGRHTHWAVEEAHVVR